MLNLKVFVVGFIVSLGWTNSGIDYLTIDFVYNIFREKNYGKHLVNAIDKRKNNVQC